VLLALAGVIVVVLIVGFIWFALNYSSSPSSPGGALSTIAQSQSANSTAIYMSSSQAQTLFGAPLDRYSTTDLFSNTPTVSASILERLVPQLSNNMTSGWVTLSNSSDTVYYPSMFYIVMATNNTPRMSTLVGAATLAPWYTYGMNLVTTNSGSVNGLTYTYAQYTNSSLWSQTVSGWKGSHVILLITYSLPGFSINETELVDAAANSAP
jgi:hypothetical protein